MVSLPSSSATTDPEGGGSGQEGKAPKTVENRAIEGGGRSGTRLENFCRNPEPTAKRGLSDSRNEAE